MDLSYLKTLTPIHPLKYTDGKNRYYIKRDDLIPFSFGGNKVRIALKFFEDFKSKNCDCMVTYGNSHSNLCRVIANMCAAKGIPCYIVSPADDLGERMETNNSRMVNLFGARVITCLKSTVAQTVSQTLTECRKQGFIPYYTHGDVHGEGNEITPVKAYVEVYEEILDYEYSNKITFDYIFHASGTGMTQAGLICGSILHNDERKIIGISVARNEDIGVCAVHKYVNNYLMSISHQIQNNIQIDFTDKYVAGGYGKSNSSIFEMINAILINDGIPLDSTYTGKAFWGMTEFTKNLGIKGRNILFIHTGGTPLFFDNISDMLPSM